MNLEEYRWKCPKCCYEILSYTKTSFLQRQEAHLSGHKIEDQTKEIAKRSPVFLRLTYKDVELLRGMKIKIDDEDLP